MKRFFPGILAAVALIGLCGPLEPVRAAAGSGISKMVPKDAEVVIKLGSVETIFRYFSVTENSFFGEPIEDLEEVKEDFGFNPFNLAELKERGIDADREIGFVIQDLRVAAGEEPQVGFNGVILLPVTDGGKALSTVKTIIGNNTEGVTFAEEGPLTAFTAPGDDVKGYLGTRDGYLLLGANPKGDAGAFLKGLAEGKIPGAAEPFKTLTGDVSPGEEIFAYVDAAKIVDRNFEAIKTLMAEAGEEEGKPPAAYNNVNLAYLKDMRDGGFSMDLESKDLAIHGVFNFVPDAEALKVTEGIRIDRSPILKVSDNPAVLLSYGINPSKYYEMVVESLTPEQRESFQQALAGFKTNFGVDLEADIVENLGGTINLGIFDGMSISMTNYNTLLTLNLKEPGKMTAVFEALLAKMPPEQAQTVVKTTIAGVDTYVASVMGMFQLYFGVKGDHLIVSVGKPLFEKAVSGDVSAGFLLSLKDTDLVDVLKDNTTNIFYLGVDEVFKAVRNFSAFLQQFAKEGEAPIDEKIAKGVAPFRYLLSTSRQKGTAMFTSAVVRTTFSEPFLKGVLKIKEELKSETPAPAEGAEDSAPKKK